MTLMEAYVSIPYEREGVSKEILDFRNDDDTMFQFPTNGKAYPKRTKRCIPHLAT